MSCLSYRRLSACLQRNKQSTPRNADISTPPAGWIQAREGVLRLLYPSLMKFCRNFLYRITQKRILYVFKQEFNSMKLLELLQK